MRRQLFRCIAAAGVVALVSTAGVAPAATAATASRSQQVTIDLIAATLRRLGENPAATRLKRNFAARTVRFRNLGGDGVNAETGQEGGRNVMDLDVSLVDRIAGYEKLLAKRPYGPSSVLVDVALTVMHEDVHMRQANPANTPEFEDPAYLEVASTLRRWLGRLEAEAKTLLASRPSATRTAKMSELLDLVSQLKTQAATMGEAYDRNVLDGKVSPNLPVGFDQLGARLASLQASLSGSPTTTTMAAAVGCAAIPGLWSWFVNGDVTFFANGTLVQGKLTGSWTCTGNSVAISWSHGYYDKITLSADGRKMSGYGSTDPNASSGFAVSGSKK